MSEDKKIEIIPLEAIIDLQISGSFYKRIQEVILHYSKLVPEKEFAIHYKNVITMGDKCKDPYEYHLYTLLALAHEIEQNAKRDNKTITKSEDVLSKIDPDNIP